MKVSTVVALLVAAATSLASLPTNAQPREERGGRVPYGPKMRPQQPPRPQPRPGDWVQLATPTPTRFGTEWIVVGPSTGAFRTLSIEATSGTVHLRRVRVEFANGKTTTFAVDKWLNLRHPNARIDFGAPRRIDRIAVTTTRTPAGTYAVYGAWSLPAGDLIARR